MRVALPLDSALSLRKDLPSAYVRTSTAGSRGQAQEQPLKVDLLWGEGVLQDCRPTATTRVSLPLVVPISSERERLERLAAGNGHGQAPTREELRALAPTLTALMEMEALLDEPEVPHAVATIGEGDRALAQEPPGGAVAGGLVVPVALWPEPVPDCTYLSGAAGSGKTFAVKQVMETEVGRGWLLVATTGIAALNLGGSTINSALGYFDTKDLQERYLSGALTARLRALYKSGVRRLVLDEVSMLEADQLTFLCKALDELSGKGYALDQDEQKDPPSVGLTLVGDFLQLPPVQGGFAWESPEWRRFEEPGATICLTEIRRQADQDFIQMLRDARAGKGDKVVEYLQAGAGIASQTDDTFEGPTLLAKNQQVDRYNWLRMSRLSTPDATFENSRWGEQRAEWGSPKKPPAQWGIPERLLLKEGALVMILANTREQGPPPQPYKYVNGDTGIVVQMDPAQHLCYVRLHRNNRVVAVEYVTREVLKPADAERRKELRALGQEARIKEGGKWEITGEVTYLPIRLAYATTVHKSQGLSLDRVQVNISDGFFKTPGMVYVALSRARTPQGLRVVGTPAALAERCVIDPRLARWA